METKKAQVHMLPTKIKTNIGIIGSSYNIKYIKQPKSNYPEVKYFHLYITTDEEIKEGDWCYDIENKVVFQFKHFNSGVLHSDNHSQFEGNCRKIIATNDKRVKNQMLLDGFDRVYPQLSQLFIEEYCKKGDIDEVLVEYEWIKDIQAEDFTGLSCGINKLKVNSHNEITIHPIKNSWNREEVIKLLNRFSSALQVIGFSTKFERDWIEENL